MSNSNFISLLSLQTQFILAHFQSLMGFDLQKMMDSQVNGLIEDIIDHLKIKVNIKNSEKAREAKCLTQLREDLVNMRGVELNEKQKFVRIVRAITKFWKQDHDGLFKEYDVSIP